MAQQYRRNERGPQSFDEAAAVVRKEIFATNYADLLRMNEAQNLDVVLKSIEDLVKTYGVKVSTSQLRNIFDKVKREKEVAGLKLIRPQLAYAAGRATTGKEDVKKFLAFIDSLIREVDTKDKLAEFKVFFEAVVAYHKFYGSDK